MKDGFVFPGQGSQAVGMLDDLAAAYPGTIATVSEASEALGYDLWKLVTEGPAERLNQTEVTQPAMLAADVAVWRAWRSRGGGRPAIMAGHSLGEYSALVCAEAIGFADAVKLVADRGRFMQEAVPAGQGGMAAILGLDDEAVGRLCGTAAEGEILEAVNFNSPGQVVIAGSAAAVARAIAAAKSFGAKRAVALPVSVPSHCALMQSAAERMRARLESVPIKPPTVPILHNAGLRVETDVHAIRAALVRQVHAPVRWVETIRLMAGQGVTRLIECGPGRVLTGLNKRIAEGIESVAIYDAPTLDAALGAGR